MKKQSLFAALVAGSLLTLGMSAQAQYAPRHDRDGDGISNRYDPNPNVPNVVRSDRYDHRYDRQARNDRYGPYGDLDRDGIQNRADRDRDGDGVPNHRDRRPDDRRYS
jgi:hypothetical protein